MRWIGILVLGLLSCAEAQVSQRTGQAQAPIVDGEADAGDPAVVLVIIQNETNGATCTGTIVSPHVVATAAHCVHPDILEPLGPGVEFYIFLGDDVNDPAQLNDADNFVYVEKVVFDPEFDAVVSRTSPSLHDVGAIVTETAMPVPPMPIRRGPIGDDWIGQQARTLGYGLTIPGDVDSGGKKYQGAVTIAGVDETHLWIEGTGPNLCGGDSGGPTLIVDNGVESLGGIHSWVQHAASCTGKSYDMRADLLLPALLDPLIAEYDPGFVPPPDGSSEGGNGGGGGDGGEGGGATGGARPQDDGVDEEEPSDCSATGSGASPWSALTLMTLAALGWKLRRGRRLHAS